MAEALLFVSTGSLLVIGAATLGIAIITLRDARKYVELAENRMEYLREEQARLLLLLHEERQRLKEELEQRVGARQPVRQEREGREIQQDQGVEQGSSSSRSEGSFEDLLATRELLREKTLPTEEARGPERTSRPASFFETKASEPAEVPPEDERPRLAVWHPHPDDDVSPEGASVGQARAPHDAAPVEMFRKHYDKYLENYEGYVKLAERIYRMRDDAEAAPGPLAEREWEERLRRVNDGIKRTTARLDILEEYNPELATDDRISRRASIARSHAELEKSRLNRRK